jgi:octaprenyl-diphosphate synthase
MSGKRIRPALALLGAALVSEKRGQALFFTNGSRAREKVPDPVKLATAVEMIHTATLLHDDVIDGASLRRGISTLNAKWGDTLSVLSGDFLYSKAFCLLSELDHPAVLRLMSDTARIVCEGEVAQIERQYDLTLTRSTYLKIIDRKTASLMGGSAQAGALLGGATPARAARLGTFGRSFGIAFQILDDAQDLVGDEETLGKSLGTDLALGQLTLPLLHLRDVAHPELRSQLAQWFNGNGSRSAAQAREQLQSIKEEAIRLRVPAYCRRVADRYLLQARQALAPFPDSPHKASLLALTEFLVR